MESDIKHTKPLIIAIDGYSSCGKSTIAKDLAKKFGYRFIDSGAMYRAVSYFLIEQGVGLIDNQTAIDEALQNIKIHFENIDGNNVLFLNDRALTSEIRSHQVSNIVSEVASNSKVRTKLVAIQQSYADDQMDAGLVMDGRDIGSVVFPNADFKFFVTADIDVRAQRRYKELLGTDNELSLVDVKANLSHRDHIDSTRSDSPLIQTSDAIVIDTTLHDRDSQLQELIDHIQASV